MRRSRVRVPRVAKDLLLWASISLPAVLRLSGFDLFDDGHHPAWWELTGGVAVLGVAVALSRIAPLASLWLAVALSGWNTSDLLSASYLVATVVLAYLAGRRTARARPALVGFAAVVAIAGSRTLIAEAGTVSLLNCVMAVAFTMAFPWLVGRYRRQEAKLIKASWERAERLEREQTIVAGQARLRERSRIAQDMHDSLGHELSLIALRAGALELAADLTERQRREAAQLRSGAVTATDRLQEIIGVLRDGAEAAPVQPARETISDLVSRVGDSGMSVELRQDGTAGDLPVGIDRAAYRVVQEALTNATKHAPGARVTVRLAYRDSEFVITVTNGAPTSVPQPGRATGGHGLIGLRERVRLVGGTLDAGPRDGGFEVVARLPTIGELGG